KLDQNPVTLLAFFQRFFGSFALADIAQDCLEIAAPDRGNRDFHGNNLAVLAQELSLKPQSTFPRQFFQSLLEQVAFLGQISIRNAGANEIVLRNSSELCAGTVSQNADAVSVNHIDRVR